MSHSEFKVFKGKIEDIAAIQQAMESFVVSKQVSARSIGIEYIEHSKEVLISLGYSNEGDHVPVSIAMVNLGKVDTNDTTTIERLMSEAAKKQQNVICHELCITENDEFMMLFMSTK